MKELKKGQKARVITQGLRQCGHLFIIGDVVVFTGLTSKKPSGIVMSGFEDEHGGFQFLDAWDYELIEE